MLFETLRAASARLEHVPGDHLEGWLQCCLLEAPPRVLAFLTSSQVMPMVQEPENHCLGLPLHSPEKKTVKPESVYFQ